MFALTLALSKADDAMHPTAGSTGDVSSFSPAPPLSTDLAIKADQLI